MKKVAVDYRKLRFNNISSDEFCHLKLLLFWPVFGLLFLFAERFYHVDNYHVMYCAADDIIPFCEWFVIPYLFWFIYIIGMHIYTLLYDVEAFRRMMKYIIITHTITIIIYFLFPTCQQLRPEQFIRDNILTRFMSDFYRFDTNTNVCPSLHVIGSLAVMEAALWSEKIKSKGVKAAFVVTAILICASTVFLKQHSVLDLVAAVPVCFLAHTVCYKKTHKAQHADKAAVQ